MTISLIQRVAGLYTYILSVTKFLFTPSIQAIHNIVQSCQNARTIVT